jgi:hypothetical protein
MKLRSEKSAGAVLPTALTGRLRIVIAYSPMAANLALLGSFFRPYFLANSSGVKVNWWPSSVIAT